MRFSTLSLTIPASTEPLIVEAPGIRLQSALVPPHGLPEAPAVDRWVHRRRGERPMALAGQRGVLTEDLFGAAGLELTRQVWRQSNGAAVALRLRLANTSAHDMALDALIPLAAYGPQALLVQEESAGRWEVVAQARYKNGVPTALRPGTFDEDYRQAVSLTGEQGDAPTDADGQRISFEMDPCGVVRALGDDQSPCLLVGYLSQTGHLARIVVRTDAARQHLEALEAECEFDGSLLPAGGERSSQWVWLQVADDPQGLVTEFADRVGTYHHVAPPRERPPSVLCSWYYYGPHFAESDLRRDLEYLSCHRLPFDVFLIDECWDMRWGDWLGNDRWPSGMKDAADRIAALGYRPGIWTCPYLVKVDAEMAVTHGDWLLRYRDGRPHVFEMDGPNYVLDPTYPGVCDWIEALYRRLTEDWGYTYHKLDFLRAVFLDRRLAFCDPTATRLEAYRRGLEAVRRGIGPDAYLSVCGGHYGGSLGLADSQRSGSDVTAMWDHPPALPKLKQNIHRTWMSRLWHVDPDAMMVRRRAEPINDTRHGRLSLGLFTDDEARTIAVNQYLGGGMVCFMDRFEELDTDRLALYRHVIPPIDSPAMPLDYFASGCPSLLRTLVQPRGSGQSPWATVTACNWSHTPTRMVFTLDDRVLAGLPGDHVLAYAFFAGTFLGLYRRGEVVDVGVVAAHGSEVVKVLPWTDTPTLLATDLHLSMGGVEVAHCETDCSAVRGCLDTRWPYPVRVTAAFPAGKERRAPGHETSRQVVVASAVVAVGESGFEVHVP